MRPRHETVRYRRKHPPQFAAVRIGHGVVPEWLPVPDGFSGSEGSLPVEVREGAVVAEPGDWVLKGPNGDLHVMSDAMFRQHYERVPLHGQTAAMLKRRKRVRALVDKGRTTREIADALGVSSEMIVRDRAEMGCPAERGESHRLRPERDPRIRRMMAMFRDGASARETAEDIGVAPTTIYRWMQRVGYDPLPRKLLTRANAELLAMIHRAGRDGLTGPELAASAGTNRHTVNAQAKRLMAKGLVECRDGLSGKRRRCYVWTVTPKGWRACCGASTERPWCVRKTGEE